MRIVFEGLPGAGKSTLARSLASWLVCPLIPEWAGYSEEDWRRYPFELPHYQANDELKEQMARLSLGVVVMDRHYLGGLAYSFAQGAEASDEALSWYADAMGKDRLRPASLLVLLRIPAELSLQRQPRAASHAPYATVPGLQAVNCFYDRFLSETEPATDRLELDGRLDPAQLMDQLKEVVLALPAAPLSASASPFSPTPRRS